MESTSTSRPMLVPEVSRDNFRNICSLIEKNFEFRPEAKVPERRDFIVQLVNNTYFMYERVQLGMLRSSISLDQVRQYVRRNEAICFYLLREHFKVENVTDYLYWMHWREAKNNLSVVIENGINAEASHNRA